MANYQFFLGVDVVDTEETGVMAALALVEKEESDAAKEPIYRLHLLDRIVEENSGEDIANRIQSVLTEQPYIARTVPVINRTSAAGQRVYDALNEQGLAAIGAVLSTGTSTVAGDTSEMRVSISVDRAIEGLTALYRTRRLDPSPQQNKEIASELARGIERFGAEGAGGDGEDLHEDMAISREDGPYDALVVSTALACWIAQEHTFDPAEHLKGQMEGITDSERGPGI